MLSFWGHGWGVNINWRERVARGGLVDGCRVFLVDHSKSFYGCTFLVELRDLAKFPRNKQTNKEMYSLSLIKFSCNWTNTLVIVNC